MKEAEILKVMQNYVHNYTSHKDLTDISSIKIADVLESSFDAVDFTMQLEDKLGLGDDALDLKVWAPKFIDITFAELAVELEQIVENFKNQTL